MKSIALSATVLSLVTLGFAGAAQAQAAKLFIEGDIVRGALQGAPGPACVLNNQFKHLEKVVFRVRVRDENGKPLDNKGLKSLVVEMSDGLKIVARYGQHPPPSQGPAVDYFWTGVWAIPGDYPNGSLSYKVVATDQSGATATWEPFKSTPSQLTVVDGQIDIKLR